VADLPLLASLPLPDSDKAPPLPVWDAVLGTIAALAGNGWTPWAIREAMISAMAEER
jgi:hypothetical protein